MSTLPTFIRCRGLRLHLDAPPVDTADLSPSRTAVRPILEHLALDRRALAVQAHTSRMGSLQSPWSKSNQIAAVICCLGLLEAWLSITFLSTLSRTLAISSSSLLRASETSCASDMSPCHTLEMLTTPIST